MIALGIITGILAGCLIAAFIIHASPSVFNNGKSETPDIVYEISDDLKIVREQNGFSDPYPKYVLYRKMNGTFRKRSFIYCSVINNVNEAKNWLLWHEDITFTTQKFNN